MPLYEAFFERDKVRWTVGAAALFAFMGTGTFKSIEQALEAVENRYEIFEPGKNQEQYKTVYSNFTAIAFNQK